MFCFKEVLLVCPLNNERSRKHQKASGIISKDDSSIYL